MKKTKTYMEYQVATMDENGSRIVQTCRCLFIAKSKAINYALGHPKEMVTVIARRKNEVHKT